MRTQAIFITLFFVAFSFSCSQERKIAQCAMNPTEGNNVTGTITFTKVSDGVKVEADISGLTKGKHAIHIHEFGDCSAPDGSSAGGHFNPAAKQHGAPDAGERHAGDMGNLQADDSGNSRLEYIDHTMTLDGENSIIGKSVIIHENEDDFTTQPTGNAGGRIACGVIEAI